MIGMHVSDITHISVNTHLRMNIPTVCGIHIYSLSVTFLSFSFYEILFIEEIGVVK